MNLITESISTLVKLQKHVYGLAKKPNSNDLVFSFAGGLGRVNICKGEAVYLTQGTYNEYASLQNGPLSWAIFSSRPETLYFLDEYTMLTTEFRPHLLRVTNFDSESVSSICDISAQGKFTMSGDIETCQLRQPRSLLAIPSLNIIIIGSLNTIGYMEVSGLYSNLPATYNECKTQSHRIVIGVVVGSAIFIALLVVVVRCRNRQQPQPTSEQTER